MPELWCPAAKRMPAPFTTGSMDGVGDLRLFTWHYFVSPENMSATRGMQYLHSQRTTSHFTYTPATDELVQGLPANVPARTLRNAAGGVQTNRRGRIHMQIEVSGNSPDWPARIKQPHPNFDAMMDFLRSWGIPDRYAINDPGPGPREIPRTSGHLSHIDWAEGNNHVDYITPAPWTFSPAKKGSTAAQERALQPINGVGTPAVLVEDGYYGARTHDAFMWYVKGDRKVGWTRDNVRDVQTWVGRPRVGIFSRDDILAIQKKVGARQDGMWRLDQNYQSNTTLGLQRYLNRRIGEAK